MVKDKSQAPDQPQFTMGATTSEAKLAAQIARNPIPGPGEIVNRMGQQFTLPRAQPDSQISRDMHGTD